MHLVVDALGMPLDFELTIGQRHDSQPAPDLIERCAPRCLLADKAYDSGTIRQKLADVGAAACIPSKRDRIPQIPHDAELYKSRSDVECAFSLLKQARRFATRYEKTLRNYAAIVTIGCIYCWLRI